jgi:hypothetical protein
MAIINETYIQNFTGCLHIYSTLTGADRTTTIFRDNFPCKTLGWFKELLNKSNSKKQSIEVQKNHEKLIFSKA